MVKLKGLFILSILFLGFIVLGIALGLKMPAGYHPTSTELITENINPEVERSGNLFNPSDSATSFQEINPDSGLTVESLGGDTVIKDSLSPDTISELLIDTIDHNEEMAEPEIIITADSTNSVNHEVENLEDFEDIDISNSSIRIMDSLPVDTSYQQLDTLEDF